MMDSTLKKSFYYLGIVAALYVFFYYILPVVLKILGFAFKAVFYVFMWAAIAFVIILFIAHIVKIARKEI
ncbi:MAG: hypothetical protein A2176_11835 [Spirochaetes bacterium RBG_13_51_14]|nr:MAG: hypothetical protein A2176_11835 [Spirochaetes bacterium RBG_13_51_14]